LPKNLTYIISNINKSLAFEWISDHLNRDLYNINFIILNSNDSELENYLIKNKIKVCRITYNGKKDILKSIYKVYKLLKLNQTEILHAHLFDANIVGLTAAFLARVPKRIHTRHHSDYHHLYHPNSVKFDKYINYLSTDIVAISLVVKNILIDNEGVPENKIHLIHHGFKLDDFNNCSEVSIGQLRNKYNPQNLQPVIGVISRQTEWKGIQFIIPAFKKFIKQYPDSLLIMANASGDYKSEIQQLLIGIPLRNYIEIEFENDIFSLYRLFDIYTHVPISDSLEAFGQTYVEALASDVPSVFTISGIANEFIVNEENALVVPYKDSDAIYDAWVRIYRDKDLSQKIVVKGKNDVAEKFQLKTMINKLEALYND
jgi:glycosyltransferase involved in cell wall biosynthesis